MITRIPKMLTANKRKLTETFDYVHNVMRIPHHLIVKFPQVIQATAVWESPIPHLQMPSRTEHFQDARLPLLMKKNVMNQ